MDLLAFFYSKVIDYMHSYPQLVIFQMPVIVPLLVKPSLIPVGRFLFCPLYSYPTFFLILQKCLNLFVHMSVSLIELKLLKGRYHICIAQCLTMYLEPIRYIKHIY